MPVQRRPAGYISRTVVPRDLRPLMRRRGIIRNLKTGSSREAQRRAAEFEGHVAALFRRLRQDGRMMEREQIDALVAHYLRTELDEIEVTLAEGLALSCETGRDVRQDGVIDKLREIESALSAGDHSATLTTAQAMLPNGRAQR
jgi:signal transduction histidine kinase